ncbi:hypothetical protein REPUB_Repub09cG0147900 [Reevesia pubescens]
MPAKWSSLLVLQWEVINLLVARELRKNSEKVEILSRLSLLRHRREVPNGMKGEGNDTDFTHTRKKQKFT